MWHTWASGDSTYPHWAYNTDSPGWHQYNPRTVGTMADKVAAMERSNWPLLNLYENAAYRGVRTTVCPLTTIVDAGTRSAYAYCENLPLSAIPRGWDATSHAPHGSFHGHFSCLSLRRWGSIMSQFVKRRISAMLEPAFPGDSYTQAWYLDACGNYTFQVENVAQLWGIAMDARIGGTNPRGFPEDTVGLTLDAGGPTDD